MLEVATLYAPAAVIVEEGVVFAGAKVLDAGDAHRRVLVVSGAPEDVEDVAANGLADALLVLCHKEDLQLFARRDDEVLRVGEHLHVAPVAVM